MKLRLWLLPSVLIASAAVAAGPHLIKLSSPALAGLSPTSMRVHVHGSSEEAWYEGVALGDVVRKFGAPAGPYRLVVPDETRQARWVRQVVSIDLRHLE